MPDLGAIACGHPVTAAAAEEILLEGGNAFDAVIAAQFAACVSEPVLCSLGGGGFLLAHRPGDSPVVYDFFAQTPGRRRRDDHLDFFPIHADFGTTTQEFHIGVGSAATPGSTRGMFEIHRDLGTLPMERLLAPAIVAARDGVMVNELQASIFEIVRPIYRATPEAKDTYADIEEGTLLKQPALASTLESLARSGPELFYEGEIAAAIADLCGKGGHLGREDLRDYRVIKRRPITLDYRGTTIMTNPPPSSGGLLIGFALKLLDAARIAMFGTPEHVAMLAEVMHCTNQARVDVLARTNAANELDPDLLDRYRKRILDEPRFNRGTTHISVVDEAGNVAAMTLSNGEGCGSMIPGTGIMLNNMLGEEDINPEGLGAWPVDTRMTSMMAPTLIEQGNDRRLALGSGGSNRIRTAILQVISNLLDFHDDVSEAVHRPRLHFERGVFSAECELAVASLAALKDHLGELHQWPERNLFFGGVHVVEQNGGRLSAAGDTRRGGVGKVVTTAV